MKNLNVIINLLINYKGRRKNEFWNNGAKTFEKKYEY